jgi:hypothetical protein
MPLLMIAMVTPAAVPPLPFDVPETFHAICMQEGGGKIDCDAVGKAGEVGPAQILRCYLADANAQLTSEGRPGLSIGDMKNYDKAREAFAAYCRKYHAASAEQAARLHHRGPSKQRQADKHGTAYWAGVQKYLEAQQ